MKTLISLRITRITQSTLMALDKEANETIDKLQANIEKYKTDAARLAKQNAKHDEEICTGEDIPTWENDFNATTKMRETESADFIANHKDYTEYIDAPEKEANETIEKLQADIEKYKNETDRLAKENAKHDEDFKASTKMSETENADFTANHKDYTEYMDTPDKEEDNETIEKLQTDIKKYKTDTAHFAKQNAKHDEMREIENADFIANHKEDNETIEKLQADITKYKTDAARLAKQNAKHDEFISTGEDDFKATTKMRKIENVDCIATHKDYTDTIDAPLIVRYIS